MLVYMILCARLIAARRTRSADDDMILEAPRTILVTAGDRAFASASPHLWNRLPYATDYVDSFQM